mmetsp:Transcript_19053/g.26605  ORF Transcript_19053/g.26605 Transcript_19053/m.26605 type:complete len:344 (+) Transcript_19053:8-1039(+)
MAPSPLIVHVVRVALTLVLTLSPAAATATTVRRGVTRIGIGGFAGISGRSRQWGVSENFHRFGKNNFYSSPWNGAPGGGQRRCEAQALFGAGFPRSYNDIIRRASQSTKQMLQDGKRFIEIEFPVTGLAAVSGDGEGAGEMTLSAQYTREILIALESQNKIIRVFFPDEQEAKRQKKRFGDVNNIRIDFLTRPSALSDLGLDPFKVEMKDRIQEDDEIFLIAYPSFNPNEMIAVRELSDQDTESRPIIVVNGELDRIRSGYYPPFFYPRLTSAMKGFLEYFDQALYLHNFKGSGGGALYRNYPGEFEIYRRDGLGTSVKQVYSQSTMPTLKEVSLEILPRYAN